MLKNSNANEIVYERHGTGRLFQNDTLEALTKVHPSIPFVFWLPVLLAVSIWAFVTDHTNLRSYAIFVFAGFVLWQFMEYFIHKNVFHWIGEAPWARRFHDLLHGYHHRYPDDPSRLVMPLSVSIPLAIVIAALLYLVGTPSATIPLWVGIVLGYLWYDFMHWSTHYRKPLTKWGQKIRGHHMSHHFADPGTNYGISHRYIDIIFGTEKHRQRKD